MAIRIVRLGSPRRRSEGVRIGAVRFPPRGVPKSAYAARDYYDVWLPNLAPSRQLVKLALRASDERSWRSFAKRYRAELDRSGGNKLLDLLATLSHTAAMSLGCYCQDEPRCHRSLLRELLKQRGAALVVSRDGGDPRRAKEAV